MKVFNTAFFLFFITNLVLAQNNSFNGTFLNEEIGLTLLLNGADGNYTGQFKLQEQSFAVTAQQQTDNSISGAYPYYGNQVAIQVLKAQGSYTLITEGVTIPLTFLPAQSDKGSSGAITAANLNGNLSMSAQRESLPTASKNSKEKATGTSFGDAYTGYQFNIPKEWIGKEVEGGSYLIGHNTKPGFILVMPNQYTSLSQMHQESVQGIQETGIQLMPTGEIQKYGNNGLLANYSGTIESQMVTAHAIGLISPHGNGLTILIAVRKDLYESTYLPILQSIANTVTFSKPKVSPVAEQWRNRIKGKRLLYMKTANGFSDKITIDLCSNGQFGYGSNSSGMSTGASTLTYAGQDAGQGTWTITNRGQTAMLILTYHDGEVGEYELSNRETNGQINLNGRRYFIQNGERCH